MDLAASRLIQESLTNSLRHSGAGEVLVRISSAAGWLDIDVHDTGSPRRGNGGTGHGLIGMWERVALCGGTLSFDMSDGFRVRARLPIGGPV